VDKMRELTKANKEAEGEAARVAEMMNSGLSGAFRTLKSTIEEAWLALGDQGLGGGLKIVTETATSTLRILIGTETAMDSQNTTAKMLASTLKIIGGIFAAWASLKIVTMIAGMTKALVLATGASLKFMASLLPIVAVLATGFVIFEFGRWLKDQFEDGERGAIAFEFTIKKMLATVDAGFKKLGRWGSDRHEYITRDNYIAHNKRLWKEHRKNAYGDMSMDDMAKITGPSLAPPKGLIPIPELPHVKSLRLEMERLDKEKKAKLAALGPGIPGSRAGEDFGEYVAKDLKVAQKRLDEMMKATLGWLSGVQTQAIAASQAVKDAAGGDPKDSTSAVAAALKAADAFEKEQKQLDKLKGSAEELKKEWSAFGDVTASAFEDAITSGERLQDVIAGVVTDLQKLTFRKAITGPLSNIFTNFLSGVVSSALTPGSATPSRTATPKPTGNQWTTPNAFGNAYANGRVVAMARGGIVDGFTTFPIRGGVGVMGEKTPEGILPLTRTSSGDLGVKAEGMGGGNQINFYITTKDADSFRRSRRQIIGDLSKASRIGG